MKQYTLIAAACAFTLCATAQNLNKEITVEKDYVPVERKAVKQNTLPAVQKNAVDMNAKLNYSDWAVPAAVPAKIPTMLPYGYQTNKNFDARRGYLTLGGGSQINILGNAGYRILDDKNNTLALWVQHNSTWGGKNSSKIYTTPYDVYKQKYNDNTIGADFTSRFYEGTMKISVNANFDTFNYFGMVGTNNAPATDVTPPVITYSPDNFGNQSFSNFGANGSWSNKDVDRRFKYAINLGFNYSGFNKSQFTDYKGVKETSVKVGLGGQYDINEQIAAGANVKFDYVTYNDAPIFNLDTWKAAPATNNSLGIVRIAPFLTMHRQSAMLRIGANADISFNDGTTFRFAPNVRLDVVLTPGAGLFVDVTGGKAINHIWQMKALNRYVNPSTRYGSTYTPVDAVAGLNLGSFGGFSAKLFGGFASCKDARLPFFALAPTMPSVEGFDFAIADMTSTTFYRAIDISGWKAGAELGYKYRSLVDANVRFTYSPQNKDEGCILGQDRPEYVVDANIRITPINRLAISLGYEMRGNRAVYGYQVVDGNDYWETIKLNNAMNLKVGASYQLLDNLTLFVEGNNLMNKQWDVFYGQGAQKLNILGGAMLTF